MRLKDKVKMTVKDRLKLFNQILLERGVEAVKTTISAFKTIICSNMPYFERQYSNT